MLYIMPKFFADKISQKVSLSVACCCALFTSAIVLQDYDVFSSYFYELLVGNPKAAYEKAMKVSLI